MSKEQLIEDLRELMKTESPRFPSSRFSDQEVIDYYKLLCGHIGPIPVYGFLRAMVDSFRDGRQRRVDENGGFYYTQNFRRQLNRHLMKTGMSPSKWLQMMEDKELRSVLAARYEAEIGKAKHLTGQPAERSKA